MVFLEVVCLIYGIRGLMLGYLSVDGDSSKLTGPLLYIVLMMWIMPIPIEFIGMVVWLGVLQGNSSFTPIILLMFLMGIFCSIVGFLLVWLCAETPTAKQVRQKRIRDSQDAERQNQRKKRGNRRFEDYDENEGGDRRPRRRWED